MTTTLASPTLNLSPFTNEPYTDFSQPENRQAMEQALATSSRRVRPRIPAAHRRRAHHHRQPAQVGEPVESGRGGRASPQSHARSGAPRRRGRVRLLPGTGADTPADARIAMLLARGRDPAPPQNGVRRLAGLRGRQDLARSRGRRLRGHRFLRILRARDGAACAIRSRWCSCPARRTRCCYLPLGVGVVIPPWNFPLAILAGHDRRRAGDRQHGGHQAVERDPDHRRQVRRGAARSRLPASARSRCWPGSGAAIGDLLVQHPKTRFIAFTGSRDVGLRINELAAKHQPGQIWIKRVIAEMGGKDAIIVDREADLDKAVEGVAGLGVRLPGAEVLGLLARHRGRGASTTSSWRSCRPKVAKH